MKKIIGLFILMTMYACSSTPSDSVINTAIAETEIAKPSETATEIPPTTTSEPSKTTAPTQTTSPTDTLSPTNTAEILPSATIDPRKEKLDAIIGRWEGIAKNNNFKMSVVVIIEDECDFGEICGRFDLSTIPCKGSLILDDLIEDKFIFSEDELEGNCTKGAMTYLTLYSESTLLYQSKGKFGLASGILKIIE